MVMVKTGTQGKIVGFRHDLKIEEKKESIKERILKKTYFIYQYG